MTSATKKNISTNELDSSNDASPSSNNNTDKNKKLFPQKLWELIHDPRHQQCLRWSQDGQRVYLNRDLFETNYLKTPSNQFHTQKAISFVRQMNMYGFRKVDDCFYENDNFKRDGHHLLNNMVRRHSNKSIYSGSNSYMPLPKLDHHNQTNIFASNALPLGQNIASATSSIPQTQFESLSLSIGPGIMPSAINSSSIASPRATLASTHSDTSLNSISPSPSQANQQQLPFSIQNPLTQLNNSITDQSGFQFAQQQSSPLLSSSNQIKRKQKATSSDTDTNIYGPPSLDNLYNENPSFSILNILNQHDASAMSHCIPTVSQQHLQAPFSADNLQSACNSPNKSDFSSMASASQQSSLHHRLQNLQAHNQTIPENFNLDSFDPMSSRNIPLPPYAIQHNASQETLAANLDRLNPAMTSVSYSMTGLGGIESLSQARTINNEDELDCQGLTQQQQQQQRDAWRNLFQLLGQMQQEQNLITWLGQHYQNQSGDNHQQQYMNQQSGLSQHQNYKPTVNHQLSSSSSGSYPSTINEINLRPSASSDQSSQECSSLLNSQQQVCSEENMKNFLDYFSFLEMPNNNQQQSINNNGMDQFNAAMIHQMTKNMSSIQAPQNQNDVNSLAWFILQMANFNKNDNSTSLNGSLLQSGTDQSQNPLSPSQQKLATSTSSSTISSAGASSSSRGSYRDDRLTRAKCSSRDCDKLELCSLLNNNNFSATDNNVFINNTNNNRSSSCLTQASSSGNTKSSLDRLCKQKTIASNRSINVDMSLASSKQVGKFECYQQQKVAPVLEQQVGTTKQQQMEGNTSRLLRSSTFAESCDTKRRNGVKTASRKASSASSTASSSSCSSILAPDKCLSRSVEVKKNGNNVSESSRYGVPSRKVRVVESPHHFEGNVASDTGATLPMAATAITPVADTCVDVQGNACSGATVDNNLLIYLKALIEEIFASKSSSSSTVMDTSESIASAERQI